jgi:hypothetical protein
MRSMSKFHAMALRSLFLLGATTVACEGAVAQSQSGAPVSEVPRTMKICSAARPGEHQSYRLRPSDKSVSDASFSTNWRSIATGGWFGQQAMDPCRIQVDRTLTWHNKEAVRIEVQAGDDPLALKANSERAEMLIMQDSAGREIKENRRSEKQYYASSYYFPSTWSGQQLPWSAFAPTDCGSGDQNQCNSWSIVWQFYGWASLSAAQTNVKGPQHYRFNDTDFERSGPIATGKWTDFVFFVDWNDGAFTLWRRDEGEAEFVRVLSGKRAVLPGRDIYVKQGLYRGGNVGGRTDILWLGPTARGSSFSAVEREAFGTNAGPVQ